MRENRIIIQNEMFKLEEDQKLYTTSSEGNTEEKLKRLVGDEGIILITNLLNTQNAILELEGGNSVSDRGEI